MAEVEHFDGWQVLQALEVNDPVMRAVQKVEMPIAVLVLWLLLVLAEGFEVKFQVIEEIVCHAHFLKQQTLLHEIDIRQFVGRTVQKLQAFGESKEGDLIAGAVEEDKRIHVFQVDAFETVAGNIYDF